MYFRNLIKALLGLLKGVFLCVDRLANALCAGFYKFTVSGRIGHFAKDRKNKYWLTLQWIVNTTFYPIDGKDHCLQAYLWELEYIRANSTNDNEYRRGNDVALALLSIVVVASCLILAPIIWFLSLLKVEFS